MRAFKKAFPATKAKKKMLKKNNNIVSGEKYSNLFAVDIDVNCLLLASNKLEFCGSSLKSFLSNPIF